MEKEGVGDLLAAIATLLTDPAYWSSAEQLEAALKTFAETRKLGFGQIAPPLRAALTSGRPAPSLGEVFFALGRAESLGRLADQAP